MYRNLWIILFGCSILVGVFFLAFTGSARGRADYIWNNATEPQTLDPGLMSGQPEGEIAMGLFEGLTMYHPDSLAPVPALAADWSINGLAYTFHIRKNAWWVKGDQKVRPATAHDIAYSWQRHFFPETGSEYSYLLYVVAGAEQYEKAVADHWSATVNRYKSEHPEILARRPSSLLPNDRLAVEKFRTEKWNELVGVKTPDDQTLIVTLHSPAPYFLALTSFYPLFAAFREAIEEHGDQWILPGNIVTNGPYTLNEWRTNAYVRLTKNQHYWETADFAAKRRKALEGKDLADYQRRELDLLDRYGPFVEKGMESMEALAIQENNTAMNLFLNGDLDRIRVIPQEVLGDLLRVSKKPDNSIPDFHHGVLGGVYYYNLNMKLPAFATGETGRKLRKAMALAVDRRGLVEVVTRGYQRPAFQFVPVGIEGYPEQRFFGSGDFEKDVVDARRLVDEIRQGGSRIPTFQILYNNDESHRKIAAFIQNGWKQYLDIDTKLSNQEWGVFLDARRTGSYDISRSGWIGDYPDPTTFLELLTTGNQNNDSKYSNPVCDRIIRDYAPRILDVLATSASRAEILKTLESSAAYRDEVSKTKQPDGQTLDGALRSALLAYGDVKEVERFERAGAIRLLLFQAAEGVAIYDMPVIPLYFYTSSQLWPAGLEGMFFNQRDSHPLKVLRWAGGARKRGTRYGAFPSLN